MPEATTSVATWSTEQKMLKMVHDRVTTGVTRVVWTAAVLRCGKQIEKLPHYYISWIVSSSNRDKCEMLPLETKQSGGKLLPHSDLRRGVLLEETPRGRCYSEDYKQKQKNILPHEISKSCTNSELYTSDVLLVLKIRFNRLRMFPNYYQVVNIKPYFFICSF
jgi:hypothetical protein